MKPALALLGAACVAACYSGGPTDGASGPGPDPTAPSCAKVSPGPAPLRRLTQTQYDNTVRDLLGDASHPAQAFPPDQRLGDFSNTAVALTVPPLLAQGYEGAAEALAARAVAKAGFVPCDPTKIGEDACAKQLIAQLGKRAYRRPLAQDEADALFALYTTNRTGADFKNGVTAVVEAMLQSAQFLYLPELGAPDRAQDGAVPLTSYEMASRLSYLLWSSMPDDALFAAADANQLVTPEQIATQARRMLADPKAKDALHDFFAQWLKVNDVDAVTKDPTTYPEFTPAVRASMHAETLAFVDWVLWGGGDGKVETLLTAPVSFLDANTAKLYGLSGVTSTTPQKTQLDPAQRAGVLTQPSILTALSKPDRSSPVVRGKFVRERLLCQPVAPPPGDLVITPPKITPGVSTREMFSQHSKVEPCKSCHTMMDPIGFGFEAFDGIGRFRTTDQGKPVDASGTLAYSDVDGDFVGAVALAKKLAQSQEVRDCVALEWFRYSVGRGDTPDDACSLATMKSAFSAASFDIRELFVAMTQTYAFRYRPQVKP